MRKDSRAFSLNGLRLASGTAGVFLSTISFRNKITGVFQNRPFVALGWCGRVFAAEHTHGKSPGGSID
jgi:hypothetical protein